MASSQAIRAGRAFVELFTDNSKLVSGLRAASAKLKAFGANVARLGGQMMAIGGAALVPLIGAAKHFANYGDQVAKMAKRTGVAVESLSVMNYVASQTGTSFESVGKAIGKMQRSIYDAGRGLSTQTDALTDLGLRYEDLADLSPEEQFTLLADRLGKVADDTTQAALSMALFGRSGADLIPMFELGAEGMDQLTAKARALGLVMSSEDAAAAEVFTDTMDSLWKSVKMGVFQVGAALAPALQKAAEWLTQISLRVREFIDANREMVVNVAKVAAIVVGVGGAFVVFGTIIGALGAVFGALATVISTVGAIIGLIASPLGLVIAAVAALGAWLFNTFVPGQTLTEKFATVIVWMRDAVVTALSMITFAFTNWQAVLQYALVTAAYHVVKFYNEAKHWLTQIPTLVMWVANNWRDILFTLVDGLKAFVTNIGKNLKALWDSIWNFIKGKGWDFEWTSLTDGFESSISTWPDIAKREVGAVEAELGALRDELGQELAADFQAHDAEFRANLADSPLGRVLGLSEETPTVEPPTVETPEMPAMPQMPELPEMPEMGDVDTQIADSVAKIEATGAFSVASTLGFQAGGRVDEKAEEKRMVQSLSKIERNTAPIRESEGMTFS